MCTALRSPNLLSLADASCCHQDGEGNSNGCEWLPVEQIGNMMCQELGYEDEPEFEDALKGTFSDFLDKLPYVVKEEKNGRWVGSCSFVDWELGGSPAAAAAAAA
jgi:RimJ/RimL family protein N-acetyltransferase